MARHLIHPPHRPSTDLANGELLVAAATFDSLRMTTMKPAPAPATLAVVDMGSNSFRLEVGRVEGDQIIGSIRNARCCASAPASMTRQP